MSTSTERRGRPVSATRRSFFVGLAAGVAWSPGTASATTVLPKLTVTKDPTCGCCSGWVDHVRAAGFEVDTVETSQINRVKVNLGVPPDLYACHTAEVDGYVIEGHVPATVIKRLLSERPRINGLAVPGMPSGSPGMDMDGASPEPFDVIAFGPAGHVVYVRVGA